MCTALFYSSAALFGRTLDLEHTYGEQVTLTPRRFPLPMRMLPPLREHYAILGMATVAKGYPLYYDGMNERGLWIAALNFPHSAVYAPPQKERRNVASFELIPYLLGRCENTRQAVAQLQKLHLCNLAFSPDMPPTPLHWMLADGHRCVVLEVTATGTHVYENPTGVMTNEPPFPHQLTHLAGYANLTAQPVSDGWQAPISRGGGSVGLPGDYSSVGRFVRAAFALHHSEDASSKEAQVSHFFHLLSTVTIPRGCVRLADGRSVITQYSCCMDPHAGIYYYRTYDNPQLCAVRWNASALEKETLQCIPVLPKQ